MSQTVRRWVDLLRNVLAERRELIDAVERDDGPAIIVLLERYKAEAQHELDEFTRSHPREEARVRRLFRLEGESETRWDEHDWDRWELISDEAHELRNDPEVAWYLEERGQRSRSISEWNRRIRRAKDVAGIEPMPVRSRHRDDPDEIDG